MDHVSTGRLLGCGVTTAGEGYCWGNSDFGKLGNGQTGWSDTPQLILGGQTWSRIEASLNHVCGVTTTGEAYCWGSNEYGQLGNGTFNADTNATPQLVSGGLTFTDISSGGEGSQGLSCGLTTSQDVYCWGAGAGGQLGNGTQTERQTTPVLVSGGLKFVDVTAGIQKACGVTVSNEAYCWGSGPLGSNQFSNSSTPVPVFTDQMPIDDRTITGVRAGRNVLLQTANGSLYGFGDDWISAAGTGSGTDYPTVRVGGNW